MEEIEAAVAGTVSSEQAVKLCQCLDHIEELETHKEKIITEISHITEPFSDVLAFLRTVHGFDSNPMTAVTVLSEIGSDMTVSLRRRISAHGEDAVQEMTRAEAR